MARFTTNVSSSSSPFAQIARKKVLKKRVREDSSNGESDDFDSSENNNGDSTDSENDEYDGMSAAAIKKKKKIAALAVIKAKLASVAQPRKKMRSVLADSDDSGEDSWGSGDDDAAYGASRKKPKAKAGDRNDYYEQGDGFVVGSDVFVVGSDEEEPPVWVNSQDSDDASGSSRARPSRQARTRKLVKSVDLLLDDDDEVLGPGMVSAEASNHVSSDDVVFVGSLPATSTKPPAPIVIFSDEDSSFSSEEEQAVSDNESGDNEEFGADDNYEQSTEDETLQFFNTATKDQMQEILQVSPEQARLLISGRPFYEMHNLETHARRTKGIGFKIVEMYQSSLRGYMAVDDLIRRVEAVGMELLDVVRGWTAAPAPPLPSPTSTTTKTETITDLVKQDIEPIDVDQEKDDGALHIVEVDDSVVAGQPDIVAPGIILKHYQLIGVSWLNLLWKKKLSGILADEMGLGKTAQVIAFLGSLLEKGEKGIHLIIVPSSTLDNWVREFNKFCPSLIVRVYYGTQQERVYQGYELKDPETEYHVLITTYNLATGQKNDRVLFRKLNVKSLILDEGHLVKNSQALRYKYLMEIPAKFRLLLTGTPLQNNLKELMSLLSFILPKFFDHRVEEAIGRIFSGKGASAKQDMSNVMTRSRILSAKKIMQPFVLRRKKAEVLKELPKKSERTIYCDATPKQREYYDDVLLRTKRELDIVPEAVISANSALSLVPPKDMDTKDASKKISNLLMHLRKMANHPLLFRFHYTDELLAVMAKQCIKEDDFMQYRLAECLEELKVRSDFEVHQLCNYYKSLHPFALTPAHWNDAGKVQALLSILEARIANGDRLLIFSQFTKVLDILEAVMDTAGYKYVRMDGSTPVPERLKLIDKYNDNPNIFVFLLSTKAGGFGINLATANYVIMYDMDFNPFNDAQAEDRAHRVGQTRDVTVLKLVMRNTIEEQILELAKSKLRLESALGNGGHGGDGSGDGQGSGGSELRLMDMLRNSWGARRKVQGGDGDDVLRVPQSASKI